MSSRTRSAASERPPQPSSELEQAQERISEISRIIKRLYEDNVNGKISDERFMELSADYEAEQAELKKRAAALQAELDKSQAATVNAEKFMGIVRKHLAFEELTPTLLREMIEKLWCMSAAMMRTAPAGRTLRFITALSARLTCPNNRPTYPTQWPSVG